MLKLLNTNNKGDIMDVLNLTIKELKELCPVENDEILIEQHGTILDAIEEDVYEYFKEMDYSEFGAIKNFNLDHVYIDFEESCVSISGSMDIVQSRYYNYRPATRDEPSDYDVDDIRHDDIDIYLTLNTKIKITDDIILKNLLMQIYEDNRKDDDGMMLEYTHDIKDWGNPDY